MLTCVTCSKQQIEDEGEEVGARGTRSSKEAVKSLTAQIKDSLKVSGPSKGKPPIAPSSFKKGLQGYPDFETMCEGPRYPYMQPGSSSSTPAWDFTSNDPHHRSEGYDPPRQSGHLVLEDEDEPKEWMAQVEPGVQITFVSLPDGGNDLKRIRFNREMFNKWQAQRWWGENYDRIMELYNIQRFNCQALNTPSQSEDGRDSTYSRLALARESPMMNPSMNREWNKNYGGNQQYNAGPSGYGPGGSKGEGSSMEASRTTTSSRDEPSISNASDMDSEWVEQDEPGVYITIRQLIDGTRELRRVRFSREKFGEVNAKLWWEQNRERIQTQYL
ncbi:hypothetical protein QVD17_26956 [Tagetes erecta]|uniref:BRX domain-containing protein n=1 Tax=Tagetes erecta TaxID=13708 RepID=A0AAD8KC31_TARER|nr:hypothetical protein QVD17_26956 [Tagetes erecta]